jgi:hypothetical protein
MDEGDLADSCYTHTWGLSFEEGSSMAACHKLNKLVIAENPGTFHVFSLDDWTSWTSWNVDFRATLCPEASWADLVAMPHVKKMAFGGQGVLYAITCVSASGAHEVSAIDIGSQKRIGAVCAWACGKQLNELHLAAHNDLVAVSVLSCRLPASVQIFRRDDRRMQQDLAPTWTLLRTLGMDPGPVAFSTCGTRLAAPECGGAFWRYPRLADVTNWETEDDPTITYTEVHHDICTLAPYRQHWVAADVSGSMSVVRTSARRHITHGGVRSRALAYIPGLGIFVLDRQGMLVLLQDAAHTAMWGMAAVRCAWMAAVARATPRVFHA